MAARCVKFAPGAAHLLAIAEHQVCKVYLATGCLDEALGSLVLCGCSHEVWVIHAQAAAQLPRSMQGHSGQRWWCERISRSFEMCGLRCAVMLQGQAHIVDLRKTELVQTIRFDPPGSHQHNISGLAFSPQVNEITAM